MSRMTLTAVAAVLGLSLTGSAKAADYWNPTPIRPTSGWTTSNWNGNTWSNNNYHGAPDSWMTSAQREALHRRYLTPAEHDALHRGMGHHTSTSPRSRVRVPYNSYGPAASYDARYNSYDRNHHWPTWPVPNYVGGTVPYLNNGIRY